MPCFRPLTGYRGHTVNPDTGKRPIVFTPREAHTDMPITLPCGRCIGCRLERSRQWAIRCVHEASLYEKNCFITLTYDPEHLPKDHSLNLKHYQDFMKRLRKKYGAGIRFFHCGEYGEKNKRPHYHACIFNFDFEDKEIWTNRLGNTLYRSESLETLWPQGFSTIGEVTFESAAYVARYITKKVTGNISKEHYTYVDNSSGEVYDLKPEYTTMSRRPGIAKEWYNRYKNDVTQFDMVVMRGKEMRPPKFYDRCFEHDDKIAFDKMKRRRKAKAIEQQNKPGPSLHSKELCQKQKFNQLIRAYENGQT